MASIGSRGPADPHRRAPFGGCARARSRSPAALPPRTVQPRLLGFCRFDEPVRRARRDGVEPLRAGKAVWIAGAVYLGLVLAGTLYGPAVTDGYPFGSSLISAAKYVEYGVLALAVPLLARR